MPGFVNTLTEAGKATASIVLYKRRPLIGGSWDARLSYPFLPASIKFSVEGNIELVLMFDPIYRVLDMQGFIFYLV